MARWLEILAQFHFEIVHQKGKTHGNADTLSQLPCEPEECQCYDGQSVLSNQPCGACDKCKGKHQQWSLFFKVDDVGPLWARSLMHCQAGQSTTTDRARSCDSRSSPVIGGAVALWIQWSPWLCSIMKTAIADVTRGCKHLCYCLKHKTHGTGGRNIVSKELTCGRPLSPSHNVSRQKSDDVRRQQHPTGLSRKASAVTWVGGRYGENPRRSDRKRRQPQRYARDVWGSDLGSLWTMDILPRLIAMNQLLRLGWRWNTGSRPITEVKQRWAG